MAIKIVLPLDTSPQPVKDNTFTSWLLTPLTEFANLPAAQLADMKKFHNRNNPPKTSITYPGWDDVILLGQEDNPSKEKKAEWVEWRKKAKEMGFEKLGFDLTKIHNAEKRVGRSPISDQQIKTLQKRFLRMLRMRASPIPKTIQSIGSIMTWFDDIQDGLVTTSYLYRVGLKIMLKAAPRLGLRLIPGLGYINNAKDLFDLMSYIKATKLLRMASKRSISVVVSDIPTIGKKSVYAYKRLGNFYPTFREAIQIAQTTAQLTGYGIRLGGVVGAGLDTVFGAFRGSELRGWARYVFPEVAGLQALERAKKRIKSPNMTPASMTCIQTLSAAPHVMMHAADFSVEDNLIILTAVHQAVSLLKETGDLRDYERWAKPFLDEPVTAPAITSDVRDDFIAADLPDPGQFGQFDLLGGVDSMTPRNSSALIGSSIEDNFAVWLKPLGSDPRVAYAMTLISEIGENMIKMFEGPDIKITTKMIPEVKASNILAEMGLNKYLGTPPALEQAVYENITNIVIRGHGLNPRYDAVKATIDLLKFIPL